MEGQPCPYKVVDDMGGAFAMGAFGGGIYHFIRGWRNSPKGNRFHGALTSMRLRAPATGGAFALWGGSFCTFDCTFIYLRKKEDPWNAIMAGASTGGLLAARAGTKAIITGAAVGGVLLGMIEGMGIMMQRMLSAPNKSMMPQINHKRKPPPPRATNVYGIPTDDPQRLSSELGFNDVAELEAEDRF
mmetsp:Transcript_7088/g.9720  ORF Transcript_7088/g.9720 Transcript_7088/m.9720 type:complete len:187 (-) Transcript_7088:240-800(-)|eukprot:CAMPEP_0185266200 /NCGR_PEP_ID=MMETSP1359-20130426/30285_1 /TAXON_ID=552665 /ORGANISM="Bigelowiella longifila, Strain CCMP242" /LENGTH=186 /DNA_ID=CAMNT_0027855893 /DNA_START=124 /DNA_END=684 /DNA_ORIENTATION=-